MSMIHSVSEAKRKEKEQLKKDIERFLAKGGKIKDLRNEKPKEKASTWKTFKV